MIVRLYTGADGESHFEDVAPAFKAENGVERAPLEDAKGVVFSRHPAGHFMDWHNAPRRQYVIVLAGQVEIRVGDGSARRLGPGDVLLAEDLTGHGHTTRVVGGEPRLSASIPLTGHPSTP
jgi:quercetin dioxygenase-like cupin family protein